MKKILATALCLSCLGAMNAQKAVLDQAQKLSGKLDKVADARNLIKDAMNNPETANDARTYFVAGKIELDAFDEGFKKLSINPDDPAVNKVDMGNQLVNGFNYFMMAFPKDSLPNEKGQVKPKYSKDMASRLSGHHADYFKFGGELYNTQHFYPDAYDAFMIYGDIPGYDWSSKDTKLVSDTTLALAYYYAGISAYSGNQLKDAIKALKKARKKGITDPQSYVYEIASWQNLASKDSTLETVSKKEIEDIALDGYNAFGIRQPLFINSLASTYVEDNQFDKAFDLVNKQINATPDESFLYALRAWIYDRNGKDQDALEDYIKGASFDNANVETLNRAARKLYSHGTVVWNAIDGEDGAAKRADVKTKYWDKALEFVTRALEIDPGNPESEKILDSVDYVLSLNYPDYAEKRKEKEKKLNDDAESDSEEIRKEKEKKLNDDKKRQALIKKYGKTMVENCYNNNVIVGMPIDLIKAVQDPYIIKIEANYFWFRVKNPWGGNADIRVNKKTGKVDKIKLF